LAVGASVLSLFFKGALLLLLETGGCQKLPVILFFFLEKRITGKDDKEAKNTNVPTPVRIVHARPRTHNVDASEFAHGDGEHAF